MVLVDEFKFPHVVYQMGREGLTADGVKYGYNKMFDFLGLKEKLHLGITLIVSPKWIFLAPIERPYHFETQKLIPGATLEEGVPVFLDGFAYAGIINL